MANKTIRKYKYNFNSNPQYRVIKNFRAMEEASKVKLIITNIKYPHN